MYSKVYTCTSHRSYTVYRLIVQCLSTLVQFGGFLATHLSPDEYSSRVPTLDKLGLEYNVPSDVAFFMLRPVIHNSISVTAWALFRVSHACMCVTIEYIVYTL